MARGAGRARRRARPRRRRGDQRGHPELLVAYGRAAARSSGWTSTCRRPPSGSGSPGTGRCSAVNPRAMLRTMLEAPRAALRRGRHARPWPPAAASPTTSSPRSLAACRGRSRDEAGAPSPASRRTTSSSAPVRRPSSGCVLDGTARGRRRARAAAGRRRRGRGRDAAARRASPPRRSSSPTARRPRPPRSPAARWERVRPARADPLATPSSASAGERSPTSPASSPPTWLRGVRVVQVPTSLLGMVDAAVGGKTGINTAAGKNLVGAFHPPAGVLADTDAAGRPAGGGVPLRAGRGGQVRLHRRRARSSSCSRPTRPARAATPRELDRRARCGSRPTPWARTCYDTGRREFLNYGHTLGHAIERVEDFGWRHGEAVAVGLVFAAELGRAGRPARRRADVDRHRTLIAAHGPADPLRRRLGRAAGGRCAWTRRPAARRCGSSSSTGSATRTILTDPDQAWLDAAWAAVSGRRSA